MALKAKTAPLSVRQRVMEVQEVPPARAVAPAVPVEAPKAAMETMKGFEALQRAQEEEFQPRFLTTGQVLRYLQMRPEIAKFFSLGWERVLQADLIEQYVWWIGPDKVVVRVAKDWFDGCESNPPLGLCAADTNDISRRAT